MVDICWYFVRSWLHVCWSFIDEVSWSWLAACVIFRCVTNVKEWRKRTCLCTADVPETLTSRSQPRFLLSNTSFSLVNKATFNLFLTLFFFPSSKELLRADHGVSEHRVSLQHELPGGDHRLVGCYEPAHQPERPLNVTSAPPALPPLHLWRPDGVSAGSWWAGLEEVMALWTVDIFVLIMSW